MKILVFNGSPKKEKDDTMHITRALLTEIGSSMIPEETYTKIVNGKV